MADLSVAAFSAVSSTAFSTVFPAASAVFSPTVAPAAGLAAFAAAASPTSSAAAAALAWAGASTTVELSGPGQLFASLSAFRSEMKRLQQDLTAGGSVPDFAGLAAAGGRFAAAFNHLQQAFATAQSSSGDALSQLLAGRFAPALDERLLATFASSDSSLARLNQLGIALQPLATAGTPRLLSVDLATLQSAFAGDRAGTLSLLRQAGQSFGNLAAELENQLGTALAGQGAPARAGSLNTLGLAQRLPADTALNTLLPAILGPATTTAATPDTVLRDLLANPGLPALTAAAANAAAPLAAAPATAATAEPSSAASRASQLLQDLLRDAGFLALRNAKDPNLAAVLAAPRLSEFVLRSAVVNTATLGAGATSAVAAARPLRTLTPEEESTSRALRNALAGTP